MPDEVLRENVKDLRNPRLHEEERAILLGLVVRSFQRVAERRLGRERSDDDVGQEHEDGFQDVAPRGLSEDAPSAVVHVDALPE